MRTSCDVCKKDFVDDLKNTNGTTFASFNVDTGWKYVSVCKECHDEFQSFIAMRSKEMAA